MERTKSEKIGQVIEQLSPQIDHLDASMSVDVLTKSVLKKEVVCNRLTQIAEYKFLVEQLEIDVGDALRIDVKRLTDSLNANRKGFS